MEIMKSKITFVYQIEIVDSTDMIVVTKSQIYEVLDHAVNSVVAMMRISTDQMIFNIIKISQVNGVETKSAYSSTHGSVASEWFRR